MHSSTDILQQWKEVCLIGFYNWGFGGFHTIVSNAKQNQKECLYEIKKKSKGKTNKTERVVKNGGLNVKKCCP